MSLPLISFLSRLTWLFYAIQGLIVRSRVRQLPAAAGPTSFDHAGKEPAIRLLVIGDSTVAGLGVDRTEDALAAQIATIMAQRSGRALACQSYASVGATADIVADLAARLPPSPEWTHIVASVGTNDAKDFRSVPRFKADLDRLFEILKTHSPAARIVWPTVVDMRSAPSLPWPLGQFIEWRALLINAGGRQVCAEYGVHASPRLEVKDPQSFFSPDGFHVSKEGYRQCAEVLAETALGGRQ